MDHSRTPIARQLGLSDITTFDNFCEVLELRGAGRDALEESLKAAGELIDLGQMHCGILEVRTGWEHLRRASAAAREKREAEAARKAESRKRTKKKPK